MLHHMIDDLKMTSAVALRLSGLAVACAVALFIAIGFLCAAIFIVVLNDYGLLQACLAGAVVFLIVTWVAALAYVLYRRQVRRAAEAEKSEKSLLSAAFSDPAMIAATLQVARTIGFKRLVPLLAIAGIAFGLSANRRRDDADQAE